MPGSAPAAAWLTTLLLAEGQVIELMSLNSLIGKR